MIYIRLRSHPQDIERSRRASGSVPERDAMRSRRALPDDIERSRDNLLGFDFHPGGAQPHPQDIERSRNALHGFKGDQVNGFDYAQPHGFDDHPDGSVPERDAMRSRRALPDDMERSRNALHGFAYRIAGQQVISDAPLEGLAAFAQGATDLPPTSPPLHSTHPERILFDDAAWIGRDTRWVTCRWSQGGYRLRIAGVGVYAISPTGEQVWQEQLDDSASPSIAQETLLGAPLILALALHETYCLHASGAARQGKMIAIGGESGTGKSTLAAALSQAQGWAHAADDILPVRWVAGGFTARPRFPQLKLARQPDVPEEIPLRAFYVLEEPQEQDQPLQVELLSPKQASLTLLRYTVASLLFDPDLLQKHLAFCAQVARQLPVYRLGYPHRPECLAQALEVLSV